MAANKLKFGFGESSKIATAIQAGTLDENDMVVTSDTDELIHIQEDGKLQYVKGRISTFESVEAATAAITAEGSHYYNGEPISVKNSEGTYDLYTVGTTEEGSAIARPVVDTSETGISWIEF